MQMKYRKAYGALEFYALALFTRTILKMRFGATVSGAKLVRCVLSLGRF